MAISTYKSFLMMKESEQWTKLIDIKSFPDLGGAPEMLETTTLSDGMQTYVPGIQAIDALEFKSNYDKTDYQKLCALKDEEHEYAVWLGGTEEGGVVTPTGSEGKFLFGGILSVYTNGGEVNAVVEMTISIAPSTPITPTFE